MLSRGGVLITGGADGVGKAVAEAFLAKGRQVHVCDFNAAALEKLLAEHPALHGTCADVGNSRDVKEIFKSANAWMGGVDVLVNNVGVAGPCVPVDEISDADWATTISANLSGAFYCIREAAPFMKSARSGAIINISTASTRTGMKNRLPYIASKTGLEGMTRSLARELGPFGVRVNAVLPGMVNGRRVQTLLERASQASSRSLDSIKAEALQFVSMRSDVEPEEVAEMIVFLGSDEARKVTGQLIGVCGNLEWEE